MSDEWGDWKEHDGQGLPDAVRGRTCECVFEMSGGVFSIAIGIAGSRGGWSWDWRWFLRRCPTGEVAARVVRYRILKPRGLTILENLIADLPAPTSPKVDA